MVDTANHIFHSNNDNHSPGEGNVQKELNVKNQLDLFKDMVKRAQTMLWSWERKFDEVMVANRKHEESLFEGMMIILKGKDKQIEELSANNASRENTQSQAVKTLERKIRQTHRASLDQKNLVFVVSLSIRRTSVRMADASIVITISLYQRAYLHEVARP
jgi:hypothetical protein